MTPQLPRKPVVGFLTHNLRRDNGAGVFSRRLIEAVRGHGYAVFALTTEGSGAPYERAILYPSRFKLLRSFFLARSVLKECDVIHALDGYPYSVIAALASLGLRIPFMVTAVGTGAIVYLRKPFYRWLTSWAYRRASVFVAISAFTKSAILRELPDLKVRVIQHGVDFERFKKARAYRGRRHSSPYLLSVGSLRYRKGYTTSIPAFAKIKDTFPDVNYVIVGKRYSEAYFKKLEDLAHELGVHERVHFYDKVDNEEELQKFYGEATAFFLTPKNSNNDFEGFGLVFLEAAAAGLPIVGTNGSGIEEAVHDGGNALLVPPGDIEGAARALASILKDESLRAKMGAASIENARAFSWESKIAEYLELYKTLVNLRR